MHLRPYQSEAIAAVKADWAAGIRETLLVMATGLGKAQPLTARVLTSRGWSTMGALTTGSEVVGSDGKPHRVLGIFPQGQLEVYRVRFSDDTVVECCADHLWTVQTKSHKCRGNGWQTKPLRDLMGDLTDGGGARKWFVPLVAPVEFDASPVPVDPYILGALIGDGYLHYKRYERGLSAYVRLASADDEVLEEFNSRLPEKASLKHVSGYDYIVASGVVGRGGGELNNGLRALGLMGKRSYEKFIPHQYLYNGTDVRLDLLRGLMDTDGEGGSEGKAPIFNTTSLQLANDVCDLVRSLGGATTVRPKKPGKYTYNGEKRTGRISYRVRISLPLNPFLLPRKAATHNSNPNQGRTKAIVSIEPAGVAECQCILIDSPDHLYVTDGYTLTHNTNTFLSLLMAELDACPDARALVIAHRTELVDQPLDRLRSIDEAWLMGGALSMPRVGVIQAQRRDLDRQLTFATVQSLRPARIAELLKHGKITHLIVDESHHATAPTYLQVRQALLDANPDLCHLGVTATPERSDGDGLAKVYQKVSAMVSIADGVKWGYLVQPRWLAISTGISIDGVHTKGGDYVAKELASKFDTPYGRQIIIQAYQRYGAGRRAIAFTASVDGAHALAAALRDAGISAGSVSGETPADERARLLGAFRKGELQVIANCQVLTEGFDAPGTSCVLMCRPTKSDSLYIQCMGRGLRPAAGRAMEGEDCLILDFVPENARNIVMAGDVLGIPKDQANAARELLKEETEPGEVQLGFTFDGHNFDTSGTPLEIVARQLDYLNISRWQWDRRDGWLTLGLGPGADGVDRTLAIAPTDEGHTLYGLRREPLSGPASGDRRYGRWSIAFTRSGPLESLCELAERQADRYAVAVLAQKNRTWHKRPATEGQLKYLRRLAPKGDRLPGFITSGEAGQLITFYTVRQAIDRLCDRSQG